MRRADRRGSEDGVRDPRLPLRDGDLGRRRSLRGRLHPGVPARSRARLELLPRADPSPSRRRAERGAPGARRARAARARSGGRHAEHRHAAHSRGKPDVVEVHGSIRSAECLGCLWVEPADAVLEQLEESAVPPCPRCGEVLKPGVVLFGELLPAGAMERATQLAREAQLVLVVGSSLEVWPVAGSPARGARVRDREPRSDRARRASDCSSSTRERARRWRRPRRARLAEPRREPLRERPAAGAERDRSAHRLALPLFGRLEEAGGNSARCLGSRPSLSTLR